MKKIFLTALAAFAFLSLTLPVEAIYLSSGSGNKASNTEENMTVLAAPAVAGDSIATVRLHFTNVAVVSWTDNSNLLSIGACSGGTKYTSTDVCVDLSNTAGPYVTGTLLGTVKVRWGNLGSATIVRTTGNGYYDGNTFSEQLGTAGSYNVVAGTGIPPTALELPFDNELFLSVAGLALIFIGAGIKIYLGGARHHLSS